MAIEAQGLEIQIGARTLLHPTDFHVAKGDKIGLVGRNGAGKTTLTRVITGDMLPTSGKVRVSGKLGYLPQDTHAADQEQTALDRMMSARDIASIISRIRKAEKDMTNPDPDIMTKAMNRSLSSVMLGGFGAETAKTSSDEGHDKVAKAGNPQDAAFIMENAAKVIIVPGYGMAVAQAQHILKEMAQDLRTLYDVEVKFAIHPVAGRMPGHMNVLLAEAKVPYDAVYEMDEINDDFGDVDVVLVIGANDTVNPSAATEPGSPIAGMPVLHVWEAGKVIVSKRKMGSAGYSGVDNPLFYNENTDMLLGDAKDSVDAIIAAL